MKLGGCKMKRRLEILGQNCDVLSPTFLSCRYMILHSLTLRGEPCKMIDLGKDGQRSLTKRENPIKSWVWYINWV